MLDDTLTDSYTDVSMFLKFRARFLWDRLHLQYDTVAEKQDKQSQCMAGQPWVSSVWAHDRST